MPRPAFSEIQFNKVHCCLALLSTMASVTIAIEHILRIRKTEDIRFDVFRMNVNAPKYLEYFFLSKIAVFCTCQYVNGMRKNLPMNFVSLTKIRAWMRFFMISIKGIILPRFRNRPNNHEF